MSLRRILSDWRTAFGILLLLVFVTLAVVPWLFAPGIPGDQAFAPGEGPSADHWLGTTSYGQDIYTQFIWGTRSSLIIAVVAGLLSTILSALVGVTSGFVGGFADGALSLVMDVFLVIPAFPLVVVIAAYSKGSGGGNLTIIAVLVATGWAYGARQLRAQVLSLRHRDFLVAARLRGETTLRIITAELLPNMTSLLIANFLGASVYAILTAAGLQFIGLGNVDTNSWGTMLYWAQNNEALQAGLPYWAVAPGLGIAALGGAFALLNYAFDEVSNPALRSARRLRVRIDP